MEKQYLTPVQLEARRQYYRELYRRHMKEDPEKYRAKQRAYQQRYWEKKAQDMRNYDSITTGKA